MIGVVVVVSALITVFAFRFASQYGAPIKGGIPATALLRGFAETGTTISSANTGPEAPVYRLDLLVSPPSGPPFETQVKQPVPRIVLPFFLPGIHVPVDIDPKNPERVKVAFQRYEAGQTVVATGPGAPGGPGVTVTVQGGSVSGVGDLVGALRSGALPTERGSAAELLRTGARGSAEIVQAMPLGKTTADVDPACPPAIRDDPIWVLTLTVELPGEASFPAVVGHRVPRSRVADVVPGLRVPVAVNLADRHGQVAVDWDAVP
ncbi:hypothetical protein [Actinotalea fermentans]|nr:hypothetical protein [Actinotalea fermentans]KGM15510.1 hypothetical protein N867_07910 [Actinotalea fermentans ATCC 43279 = JCM 9966 = DSM 3133]